MKDKIRLLLRWMGIFVLCLAVIYLFVFFGGWKLFESGDPILIEIGVALVLSFFVFVFGETVSGLEKKVNVLEKRLDDLECKQQDGFEAQFDE